MSKDTPKTPAESSAETPPPGKAAAGKPAAGKPPAEKAPAGVPPRLRTKYQGEIAKALRDELKLGNPMEVPRLSKIVINMGIGKAVENKARVESAAKELATIAGQKPVITKAKHAVAGFKLREDMPIGASVTLRGPRMWEFMDRLISIAIPRIRDFRGLPTKLDGRGSYTMGLSEQSVFPEINLDKVEFVQGMNITFVTTAKNDEQGMALLSKLGIPFRKLAP